MRRRGAPCGHQPARTWEEGLPAKSGKAADAAATLRRRRLCWNARLSIVAVPAADVLLQEIARELRARSNMVG